MKRLQNKSIYTYSLIILFNVITWIFGLFVLLLQSGSDGRVAVLISPTASSSEMMNVIGSADGVFVAGTTFPFIAIAHSAVPGFRSRLIQSGAWLVFNPMLAAGCKTDT